MTVEEGKAGTSGTCIVAATQGTMYPYILGEDFSEWLNNLEVYLEINAVTVDRRKVLLLFNLIGPAASIKISKACKPDKPADKSYADIVAICEGLFMGQKNYIMGHYKFNKRSQLEGESINDFAIELQSLAENCDFKEYRDTALRDRFVAGVRSTEILKLLLNLKADKFKDFVSAAEKAEMAQKDTDTIKGASAHVASINYTKSSNSPSRQNSHSNKKWQGRGRSKSRRRFFRHQSKSPDNARFKSSQRRQNLQCYRCKGFGHYSSECPTKSSTSPSSQNNKNCKIDGSAKHKVGSVQVGFPDFGNLKLEELGYRCDSVTASKNSINHNSNILENRAKVPESEMVVLTVEGKDIKFEIDSGSCFTIISHMDYCKYFKQITIEELGFPLNVVNGTNLDIVGKIKVNVMVKNQRVTMNLVVIDCQNKFIPLLGRDWMDIVFPGWRSFFNLNAVSMISAISEPKVNEWIREIKANYSELFDNNLKDPIKEFQVDIKVNDNAHPIFHKAYNLPFCMRDKVAIELERMCDEGVLKKIANTQVEWASPIVVVSKPNGDIRICVDCSKTLNPQIASHHHPLPIIDEILAKLDGYQFYCVLDLRGAYQQLPLSENSQNLLTINTHKGLYTFTRLSYGVKPAASIFQETMEKILKDLDTDIFIDDVLIGAQTLEELHKKLIKVLDRLKKFNVKVNLSKCKFFVDKIKYLGHEISAEGVKPNAEKVKAIVKAPEPTNVTQLKSFIGLVNFYSKFVKNLNIVLSPMYQLLRKETKWNWDDNCRKSFKQCKDAIANGQLLTHYDPKKEIVIVCDASDSGLGGLICHKVNGEERPVMFVSRTLTPAEKNYPILHREALAVVWTMEKLYKYVYGHHVTIFSDHKPLEGILNNKKGEPPIIATRLQRYIHRLAIFDYELKYRKGNEVNNADFLSRLPIEIQPDDVEAIEKDETFAEVNMVSYTKPELIINLEKISAATRNDEFLRQLRQYVLNGWPESGVPENFKNYYKRNEELSVDGGCVLYDGRIIIPESLRAPILELLHENHTGIVRMKRLARSYVYWERIDRDLENCVKVCESCQVTQRDKTDKVYVSWSETSSFFERIHVDFFHFQGKNFFILIDHFSRWIEVRRTTNIDTKSVIKILDSLFDIFGACESCVSDNGPAFRSKEFEDYCKSLGIKLIHSPPLHPASNGMVERAVQTTKSVLKKFCLDEKKR